MVEKFVMNPHVLEFQCKTGSMQSKVLTFCNKSSDRSDDLEFEILNDNIFKFSQTKGYIRAGCTLNLFVTYNPANSGYHYCECSIIVKFVLPLARAAHSENQDSHDFEDLELHLKEEINNDHDSDILNSKFIDQDDESLYQIETSMFICGLSLDKEIYLNKNKSLVGKEALQIINKKQNSKCESAVIKQITEQFVQRMELEKKERLLKENEIQESRKNQVSLAPQLSAPQPINVNVSTPFNITLNSQPFTSTPLPEQLSHSNSNTIKEI